ncbi:hypothetical protein BOX15_Mlig012789g4, partial [Macrostomum lignano]
GHTSFGLCKSHCASFTLSLAHSSAQKKPSSMPGRASALFLIVASLWGACSAASIHVGVSDQQSVLDEFAAMNSSQLSSLFGNHTVTFKPINVPSGRTSADITTFVNSIRSESFSLVIGTFNELLASACSFLTIPFYSLSEKTLDPALTSSSYLSDSTTLLANALLDELMLASVNLTTQVGKRETIVMLVDDVGARLNILFERNITLEFRISVVNSSNSPEIRQQLYETTLYSPVDSTVYMIVSKQPGFASSILKEAVYLSMLKSSAIWIVPELFLDQSEILPFYATGASIITFRLPNPAIANDAQLNMSLASDVISHFIASYEKNVTNATIMEKIFMTTTVGSVSIMHFNSVDRRLDMFAADLMSVDSGSATNLTLYATWNESVSNSLPSSRTKETLKLPVLRLAGDLVKPYLMGVSGGYSGYSISVLEKISKDLFTYDLTSLKLGPNYFELVQKGEADMTVNLVELTTAHINDTRVSFSEVPLMSSGVAAMGRSAIKEVDFLSPLYPLTWNVWFAIIAAFIILSATLYLTDKISPNDYKRPKFSVAKAAFFVYSSFVMSKLKSSAVKPSSRIFILILWFASLMYCTTYGTNYFFLLIRTNPNLPFTNMQGLYDERDNYELLMVQNSTEYALMRAQNSSSVYWKLAASPPTFVPSIEAAANIVKNSTLPGRKKPIYIGDELSVNYYAAGVCELKSAGKGELSRSMHIVLSSSLDKNLISNINNRIQELSDRGELEQIKNNYWSVLLCSASENLITYSELTEVTIDQVAGIFMVLAGAFVLSFLVVAMEYIGYIIGLQVQRTRADPDLEFNKAYRALVTSITPTGVYVKLHGEKEFIPNQMLSPDASKGMTASDLQISCGS